VGRIDVKNETEIGFMTEGGKKLFQIKEELKKAVGEGVSAWDVEVLAGELIEKSGGRASFKMVPGYSWAICVNVNDAVVHGIPKKTIIFKKGDIVSVDVGIFFEGYHTDSSFSIDINGGRKLKKFLWAGAQALASAISKAHPGNRIFDISNAIEKSLKRNNLRPVNGLVGHGIGKKLHEHPHIPGTILGLNRKHSEILEPGNTLALEVMYTEGSGDIVQDPDGWTLRSSDGKITGLFEETVLVTEGGPAVLT